MSFQPSGVITPSGPYPTRAARRGVSAVRSGKFAYWQTGSPSFVAPPPSVIWQVFAVDACVAVAFQPVFVTLPSVTVTPDEARYDVPMAPVLAAYVLL
jgi:hypothetical protein